MILPGRRLKGVTQKRYRVLLVDDDPLILTRIPKDLESGGYGLDTAADGETATGVSRNTCGNGQAWRPCRPAARPAGLPVVLFKSLVRLYLLVGFLDFPELVGGEFNEFFGKTLGGDFVGMIL